MFISRGRNAHRRFKTEQPNPEHKIVPLGIMSEEEFSKAIKGGSA